MQVIDTRKVQEATMSKWEWLLRSWGLKRACIDTGLSLACFNAFHFILLFILLMNKYFNL
jgi:hypothetical protein